MCKKWIGILMVLVVLMGLMVGCGARKHSSTPDEEQGGNAVVETVVLEEDEVTALQTYFNASENNRHLFDAYTEVTIVSGTKTEDGVYVVRYRPVGAAGGMYVATLDKTEDGYRVISSQQVQ